MHAFMLTSVSYATGCPKCGHTKPLFITWRTTGFLWWKREVARMGCTQCGLAFSAAGGEGISWPAGTVER